MNFYNNFIHAVWLLFEREIPDTPYKPFFDVLPKSFEEFPINYSDEDLQLLEGTPDLERIKIMRQEYR